MSDASEAGRELRREVAFVRTKQGKGEIGVALDESRIPKQGRKLG